ncbi:hypothetical protein Y032_0303g1897 [Ancylostoma ceylanicum]|nr:hypothetical protein Y032_0303g1897 [Ancylostoma ceylanicum]
MVPTALFSSFGEEDYNQEDSGDDSDSEEPSEPAKEEAPAVEEPKKDEQAELTASLQQTLKEALKAAGTNRLMQQKRRQASPPQPPPTSQPTPAANANAFLAPFLLSGLTANTSANGTIFQLPQGCVYTTSPNSTDGRFVEEKEIGMYKYAFGEHDELMMMRTMQGNSDIKSIPRLRRFKVNQSEPVI